MQKGRKVMPLVHRYGRQDGAASVGHPDAPRRKDLDAIPAGSARSGRGEFMDTEQQDTSTAGR